MPSIRAVPLIVGLALGAVPPPGPCPAYVDEGEALLVPPAGSPRPEARGGVSVRVSNDDQRFALEVEGVDPEVELEVHLDDPVGGRGSIGILPPGDGRRALVLDTARGDSLPFGVTSVDALAGRGVEVRDTEGAAVLCGAVPAVGQEDGDPAEAEAGVSRLPHDGHSRSGGVGRGGPERGASPRGFRHPDAAAPASPDSAPAGTGASFERNPAKGR